MRTLALPFLEKEIQHQEVALRAEAARHFISDETRARCTQLATELFFLKRLRSQVRLTDTAVPVSRTPSLFGDGEW